MSEIELFPGDQSSATIRGSQISTQEEALSLSSELIQSEDGSVLCLVAGGTVVMSRNSATGRIYLDSTADDMQSLEELLQRQGPVRIVSVGNLDSSDMQPEMWAKMAELIVENEARYEGFVIVQGSDTLAWTASALSLLLNTSKPIIVTGAQIPLTEGAFSDGPANLANAMTAARLDIGEVCVAFGNSLLRGSRVTKADSAAMRSFATPNSQVLAEFGVETRFFDHHVPRRSRPMHLRSTAFDASVAWLPIFPGMSPMVLDTVLALGIRGLYLQAFGLGHVPAVSEPLITALDDAIANNVTVVLGTQCQRGGVHPSYDRCAQLLERGLVSAGDMTPEMAIVKLMWALGQTTQAEATAEVFQVCHCFERS